MIKEYRNFLEVIKPCAGLNKNLVRLRRRSILDFNHTADVQARRINPILACRHHVIVNFYFLESGNITHLDQTDTEIRTPANGAEGA